MSTCVDDISIGQIIRTRCAPLTCAHQGFVRAIQIHGVDLVAGGVTYMSLVYQGLFVKSQISFRILAGFSDSAEVFEMTFFTVRLNIADPKALRSCIRYIREETDDQAKQK